jgi:uncharacterized protein (TIGR03437 family)
MNLRLQTSIFSAAALLLTLGSGLSAASRLQLSANSIGPIYVTPDTNGPPQTVQASNAGTGTLNLSVLSSASWLVGALGTPGICSAPAGICFPVNISLNTSSLPAGNYMEYVTVQDPNAVDSPQQISVSVVIAGVPAKAALYAAPAGTASVAVYPRGPVAGAVATQSGGSWLSFTAPTGAFSFGSPYTITATAQTGQTPGTYTGSVQISGSPFPPDNTTVAVTFIVATSPIIQINNSQILLHGTASGFNVPTSVTFTNVGQGTLTITAAAATSTTNNFLTAVVTSANTIQINANAAPLTIAGTYVGNITVTSNAVNSAQVLIPIEFSVSAAGIPTISQGGIVNIGNFQPGPEAIGDIVAVFGDQFTNLASAFTVNPSPPPLQTTLGNVQVLVNGVPAPLYYVSRQQVNFEMPYTASTTQISTVQVVSSNGIAGNIRSVQAIPVNPHVLVWAPAQAAGGYGIILNAVDNTLSLPATDTGLGYTPRPSQPGDVITIYCTGLGQTTPLAQTGQPATSNPILNTGPVTVTFGSGSSQVSVQSSFSGLTPTLVGLYQVNVTIPANVPTGTSVPVSITLGTVTSNVANIPIV